ncbi:MAG: hypothetical protein ACRDLF_07130 [Solirubrobacteraceae bacterium]
MARAEQSGTVTSAEAVPTTAGAALELNPHFVPDESAMPQSVAETPVLVVAMHGHFVYQMAKVRPGTDPPEGSTFAYTVDSATGEVAATYVGNESPKLSTLGAVERFTASQSSAIISRATHRLPHIKPSRLRAKAATWGSGCKITENYHCYVLATWGMTGSEEVEATQEEQKTTTMNVPESANGDFVDMEEWVLFSNGTKYVEAGQEGGAHKGCCTIWWFWALTYGPNPGEYFAYEGPPYTWEIPYNVYAHYEWKSINPTNATWCLIIGPNWETQYACYTGFSVYTKDLEAGGEIATEQKPSFAGSQLVNGQWLNGTYKGWSFASYGTIGPKGSAPGLCYGYIGPTPGDMNYGTC